MVKLSHHACGTIGSLLKIVRRLRSTGMPGWQAACLACCLFCLGGQGAMKFQDQSKVPAWMRSLLK